MLNPVAVRREYPFFDGAGASIIYLDNAATVQKPRCVIQAVERFCSEGYANVHRSPHTLGESATEAFEGARAKVARFLGAASPAEIVFTRGTTEGINLVAAIFTRQILQPGDVILLTPAEHHSNLIPWQMAARWSGAQLEFISLHRPGVIDPDEVRRTWNPRVKVFAFQHASNVLGTVHSARELCEIAARNGALTVIDGAQAVPHLRVSVQDLGCDFYAFSGHKLGAPGGTGAVWGKAEHWERFEPVFGGGEMISRVTRTDATWNVPPFKFEPGTPNIEGAVGLGAAVDFLDSLGMDTVEQYVSNLANYAMDELARLPGVTVFGPTGLRTGAVSFWLDGVHPHDLATIFNERGIAVRAGHHCAAPLMQWLDVPATARASFYVYNTREEVARLAEAVTEAREVLTVVP